MVQSMALRPDDVSPDVWTLSLALSSFLPVAVYLGMARWILHLIDHGKQESDQAVAVVAALCVKNGAAIEMFLRLLDGLDTHPSIGEAV